MYSVAGVFILCLVLQEINSNSPPKSDDRLNFWHDPDKLKEKNARNAIDPSLLYSHWSKWSHCSRSCKRIRTRKCKSDENKLCAKTLLKERHPCTGDQCQIFQIQDLFYQFYSNSKKYMQKQSKNFAKFYSIWSHWTPCSEKCETKRFRVCVATKHCGNHIITNVATCFVEGSKCEELVKYSSANKRANAKWKLKVTPDSIKSLHCGRSSRAGRWARILGGTDTAAGKWPWQVILTSKARKIYCGAVLISRQWLMTAAHCVRNRIVAIAGRRQLLQSRETWEQRRKVTKRFVHPKYHRRTMNYDVALLKLKRPFKLNDKIQPVCLPDSNTILPPGQMMTILGWGKKNLTKKNPANILQEAQVPIVSHSTCKKAYESNVISKHMVCAGFTNGKADACLGDSGGPLLYQNPRSGQWFSYGITSFGEGCGLQNKFGIYSLVPKVAKWIKTTIMYN